VRHFAAVGAACLCLAACGTAPPSSPPPEPSTTATGTGVIDPTRIDRARYELPPDYEVADVSGRVTPLAQWGFGAGVSAEPGVCARLADPPADPATVRGWSASGPGGIVYAVAAGGAAGIDASLVGQCARWTMAAGPTTGTFDLVDAPAVAGAETVGMAADVLTVVEGGTETRSQVVTFIATEQGRLVYVTVVTDPGSPNAALGPGFAADLLTKTVAALRR
jgi:hypothetical protein